MIVFAATAPHLYTLLAAAEALGDLPVRLLRYDHITSNMAIPRATYVFTDLDRLGGERLRDAAALAAHVRGLGYRVLNDPARVLSRYGLLRKLYLSGFNDFNVYRVEERAAPQRWPVFLRTEGDHIAPMPELYRSAGELEAGIDAAVARGIPVSRMLIVEYCAEPLRPGLFRKCASFRVGPAAFGHTCVRDNQWVAKEGRRDVTTPELYEEEYRIVRDNPYWDRVRPAFEAGAVDYGRADFGFVGDRLQLYEINTNPHISFGDDHPSPLRQESYRRFRENYCAALRAIDTP
jgi:hypothetical protein